MKIFPIQFIIVNLFIIFFFLCWARKVGVGHPPITLSFFIRQKTIEVEEYFVSEDLIFFIFLFFFFMWASKVGVGHPSITLSFFIRILCFRKFNFFFYYFFFLCWASKVGVGHPSITLSFFIR